MTRLYLADVLKTNLTKFAVILSEKASKCTFLKAEKLQNHSNKGKGKEKKKERGEGKEEKRKEQWLHSFIIATLEIVFGRKKLFDAKGPFIDNVIKNPAIYIYTYDVNYIIQKAKYPLFSNSHCLVCHPARCFCGKCTLLFCLFTGTSIK